MRDGVGEQIFDKGNNIYRGQWKDDKEHGIGVSINGMHMDERKGIWEDGQLLNYIDMTDRDMGTIRTNDFEDYKQLLESKRSER
jgi:hypothetical protein